MVAIAMIRRRGAPKAGRGGYKFRKRMVYNRRDFREGFEFEGRWWTPDEVHRMCAARMEMVDQLPVELRAKLNRDGRL